MSAAGKASLMRAGWAVLAVATTLSAGCVDTLLVPAGPADDPEANFDQLWNEVDRHYSFFVEKGIDWDALYQAYRPRVSEATTDRDLFQVMSELLDELGDGHASLWAPFGRYTYFEEHQDDYPENFSWPLAEAQLASPLRHSPTRTIAYGLLTDEIGYVYVPSFQPAWAGEMDGVLDDLAGVRALVLDVRDNGGGSTDAIPSIIGRFVDERRVYARHQYRDGPAHDDFSRPFDATVEPRGTRFAGPVAVLTDRRCFSTTEEFVLAVRTVPSMFTVGDTTGGGLGNPLHRELPNGWIFRVSRWKTVLPDGTPVREGVGLAPDYPVQLSQEDVDRGVDTIIARAVALLQERLGS